MEAIGIISPDPKLIGKIIRYLRTQLTACRFERWTKKGGYTILGSNENERVLINPLRLEHTNDRQREDFWRIKSYYTQSFYYALIEYRPAQRDFLRRILLTLADKKFDFLISADDTRPFMEFVEMLQADPEWNWEEETAEYWQE